MRLLVCSYTYFLVFLVKMALTGFLRDGHCASHMNDRGSHHICINLNSTSGGNFCRATGQSDWYVWTKYRQYDVHQCASVDPSNTFVPPMLLIRTLFPTYLSCPFHSTPFRCSSSDMPCHHDKSRSCQIHNWCVCQWAFASYIQNAGGCNKIQTIVCEAINMEAMVSYEKSTAPHHKVALDCILERCESIINKEGGKDEF
jgi:hypothetical protein